MTRRGSLIYYFTAWILGCFFMSLAVWTKDVWGAARLSSGLHEAAVGLLGFYFYGLVFGGLAVLGGAFLLRRIMILLKCKTPLHWAVAAAILAPMLTGGLGIWGTHLDAGQGAEPMLIYFLVFGPKTVLEAGWWLAIPAGAATGYFLGRVQRAFDPAQRADAGMNPASA
jgi:hypothetical protein